MNRFEALNILGLEEGASEQDVRLAYYGLEKAVESCDFGDSEQLATASENMLLRAGRARDFLLSDRHQTAARKSRSAPAAKSSKKLQVSAEQQKTVLLRGFEKLRNLFLSFLENDRTKVRYSLVVIALVIVACFIVIRFLRAAPRYVAVGILAAFAVTASVILTTSQLRVRKTRGFLAGLEERIELLKRELGLVEEPEPDAADVATATGTRALEEGGGEGTSGEPDDGARH